MNYRGSYRKLLANSKSAMLAAIEIYNKPSFTYRDECSCILLVNAWELLAKAILSKNKESVFYTKKQHGTAYRTYSLNHALMKAKPYFPVSVSYEPVKENISSLVAYRDNAIHYYNSPGMSLPVYALAQTTIVAYKDLVYEVFGQDITEEITITLLPLGLGFAPDPIEFLRDKCTDPPSNKIVANFLSNLVETTKRLEDQGLDTGRFLTHFDVSLRSVKKISSADLVVGIDGTSAGNGQKLVVEKRIDSNISHPLKRKEILEKIGTNLNGRKFSSYTIDAIIYKFNIKDKKQYFWKALGGGAFQFSREFVAFIKNLSVSNHENALAEYKQYRARNRRNRKSRK